MKKVVVAALAILFLCAAPAGATRNTIGGQSAPPNICHSKWMHSLGNPPCETMTEPPRIRCDLDKPYYEIWYRFRWYDGTDWSQWWLYYRWFKVAPQKVCGA